MLLDFPNQPLGDAPLDQITLHTVLQHPRCYPKPLSLSLSLSLARARALSQNTHVLTTALSSAKPSIAAMRDTTEMK